MGGLRRKYEMVICERRVTSVECGLVHRKKLKLVSQLEWVSLATSSCSGAGKREQMGGQEWLCWATEAGRQGN